MVERGHQDGVAPDNWVAYEYAKVRRMYDTLGLGDRTEIDLPDSYLAWKDLSATGETCLGKECHAWEDCFVQLARARAAAAREAGAHHRSDRLVRLVERVAAGESA